MSFVCVFNVFVYLFMYGVYEGFNFVCVSCGSCASVVFLQCTRVEILWCAGDVCGGFSCLKFHNIHKALFLGFFCDLTLFFLHH